MITCTSIQISRNSKHIRRIAESLWQFGGKLLHADNR